MKEVNKIILVLENCENIEIPRKFIGSFSLESIGRNISRRAINSISDCKSAEKLFLQINSRANNCNIAKGMLDDRLPFDRLLLFNDITAISIKYVDGTEEYIFVPWNKDDEYNNKYQSSKRGVNTKDLFIIVSKEDTVEDYFSDELAEDYEEYVWNFYE